MSEEHAYRVAAWWTSGRTGLAKSDSAPNAIHFTAPTEFGGLEGRWTPEELLLAAIAGCYTTTVRAIAGGAQFDFTDLQVEASGTVRKAESGYSFTQIVLRPNLKIGSSEERDRALELLKRAEKLCLVSRALGTTLKFEPQLEITKPAPVACTDLRGAPGLAEVARPGISNFDHYVFPCFAKSVTWGPSDSRSVTIRRP